VRLSRKRFVNLPQLIGLRVRVHPDNDGDIEDLLDDLRLAQEVHYDFIGNGVKLAIR
jgi:hypothetical protein